jgi:hypothetical protein
LAALLTLIFVLETLLLGADATGGSCGSTWLKKVKGLI